MSEEKEVVQSIDLKDTMEYFAALDLIADKFSAIVEDGKFDWNDAEHFISLATDYKVFVDAIKDSGNVPAELKDLDEAELLQMGIAAFAIVKKMSKAIKASIAMGKKAPARKAPKKK